MVKDGTLNTLAIIGYAFTAIFTVMALVIGIYWGATGFKDKEKEIDNLVFVAQEDTDEVITQNNTMNISSTNIEKIIEFSLAGTENPEEEQTSGGLTKKITLTINNEYKNFRAASVDSTSIWFVAKDENGNPKKVKDEGTDVEHYVRIEANKLTARVDEKIYIMLATTTFDDETLQSFFLDEDFEEYEYKTDIKGGLSYIHARSEDGLFVAKDLEVKVDVPVRSAKIVVEGYGYDGKYDDLTAKIAKTQNVEYNHIFTSIAGLNSFLQTFTPSESTLNTTIYYKTDEENSTQNIDNVSYISGNFYTVKKDEVKNEYKFVQNTSLTFGELQYFLEGTNLNLSIKTFPENALIPLSKTLKNFSFELIGVNQNTARILNDDINDNVLEIDRDKTKDDSFQFGAIKIKATVQVLLNSASTIETEFVIQSAKTEAQSISSKNDKITEIIVPVNGSQELHAKGLLENNSTYLDIEIIPKFYNQHNNPYAGKYDILRARISDNHGDEAGQVNITSLGDTNKNYTNAISKTDDVASNDKTFTFNASRLLFGDEQVFFEISVDDNFEEGKTIKIPISSSIVLPESNELTYTQSHSISITKESAEFLSAVIGAEVTEDKILDQEAVGEDELEVSLSSSSPKNLTYNKWVYFLSTATGQNESDRGESTPDPNDEENASSESAIKYTKAKQIVSGDGGRFGNEIYAQNQGGEQIAPKLVLCDEAGYPLNYKYERFTPDDDTGFILFDETTNFSGLTNDYANCYVVLFAPKNLVSVTVSERLTKFAFFHNYDTESGDYSNLFDVKITDINRFSETIQVPLNSTKTVYAMANSTNALTNFLTDNQFDIYKDFSTTGNIAITQLTKAGEEEGAEIKTGIQISFTPSAVTQNNSPFTANIIKDGDIDEAFGSFVGEVIDVDVARISGIFESTNSLTPYLTASDVGKIAYYTENNGFITTSKTLIYNSRFAIGNTVYTIKDEIIEGNLVKNIYAEDSEEPIQVVSNSFSIDSATYYINGNFVETRQSIAKGYYIVKSQTESGVTTYYWDSYPTTGDKVWWYDNQKEIRMRYERNNSNNLKFFEDNPIKHMYYDAYPDSNNGEYPFEIPAQIYRTLNITKTNGNEGVTLTGTYQDVYEIINYSGTNPLTLSTYGGVDNNNNPLVTTPNNIKLREAESQLFIDLYEGWTSEINNLYLVYKTSLISGQAGNQTTTLKAIDAYKLTFDDTNYVITDKTSNADTFVFDSSDKKLKLSGTAVTISDLIKLVDMNNNSTEYDISPVAITAKLFRGNNDLSQYITVSVNPSTGEISCSPADGYVFDNNSNNSTPVSSSDNLKLVLYMFDYDAGVDPVSFVIEIDSTCKLSFNINAAS